MTEPDDDLERRVRDVLRDGALRVPAAPDAIERVHAGARRRQHTRNAASSAAAVVVVAMAATGVVALRPHAHATVSAANQHTTSPSVSMTPSRVGVVSPAPTTALPSGSESPRPSISTVAVNFDPISVTAISTNSYWVLGSTACAAVRCAVLAHTTDGGATFTRLGRTTDGSPMPAIATDVESGSTVRDVRFGDPENGWLYGGSLYSTKDGGETWAPDNSIPNDVVDIAAASGDVWAVALRVIGSGESYGLYHATYGATGTSAWAEVNLGVQLAAKPSLAVINQTAFVAADPNAAAPGVTFVVTSSGRRHVAQPGPCGIQQDGTLSVAGDGSLWAVCQLGHSSVLHSSTDQAAHWQSNSFGSLTYAVGAVDAQHAVVFDGNGLADVTGAGSSSSLSTPPGAAQPTGAIFIGFTTTNVGFAVVSDQNSGSELWRTTDGGQTWAVVAL